LEVEDNETRKYKVLNFKIIKIHSFVVRNINKSTALNEWFDLQTYLEWERLQSKFDSFCRSEPTLIQEVTVSFASNFNKGKTFLLLLCHEHLKFCENFQGGNFFVKRNVEVFAYLKRNHLYNLSGFHLG